MLSIQRRANFIKYLGDQSFKENVLCFYGLEAHSLCEPAARWRTYAVKNFGKDGLNLVAKMERGKIN